MIKKIIICFVLFFIYGNAQKISGDYYSIEPKCNFRLKIDSQKRFIFYINKKKKTSGTIKISKEDHSTYLTFGNVGSLYANDTIYIQNSGNADNPYWNFKECNDKFIHLAKQKVITPITTVKVCSQNQKLSSLLKFNFIISELHNDFNDDGTKDDLYIFANNTEKETAVTNAGINKRNLLIIFNDKKGNSFYYENDGIFPCRECLGKSDNDISDLKFENNLLSYKTTVAPFASDHYSIINFSLKFSDNSFTICDYEEKYYKAGEDNEASIALTNSDIPKIKFNYYEWVADKSWLDYVIISSQNVLKLNDFAYKIQNTNNSLAIELLQKILDKYPDRVVAYLNIADSYWLDGDKAKAQENYIKYVALMKSQNKGIRKIPSRVWERIK